jgi:hypothetical protein
MKIKHPNPKRQTPEKLQTSNLKHKNTPAGSLIGGWCLVILWSLKGKCHDLWVGEVTGPVSQ